MESLSISEDSMDWLDTATSVLCKSYFVKHGYCRHQIDSYERFMENTLPSMIESKDSIEVICGSSKIVLRFTNTTTLPMYHKKHDGVVRSVTPEECLQRKLTYRNGICVDIMQDSYKSKIINGVLSWEIVKSYEFAEVPMFKIPCMVRSKFCCLNDKPPETINDFMCGYFIVNGIEKTVQAQIKLRADAIHVFKTPGSDYSFYAEVRSSNDSHWKATYSIRVNISPLSKERNGRCPNLPMSLINADTICGISRYELNAKTPQVVISLPFFPQPIPISSMCRLYGKPLTVSMMMGAGVGIINSDCPDIELRLIYETCCEDPYSHLTRDELILKLGSESTKEKTPEKRVAYILEMMRQDILPHLGCDDDDNTASRKVVYILIMAAKVISTYFLSLKNKKQIGFKDDRDNWRFKKVDCSGGLIAVLVRQLMRTFLALFRHHCISHLILVQISTQFVLLMAL